MPGDIARVCAALGLIPGVARVSRGWDKSAYALPCVVVELAGEEAGATRDDAEYLTRTEYYVRLFTAREEDADRIGLAAMEVMREMGYERVMRWENGDGNVFRQDARYRGIK